MLWLAAGSTPSFDRNEPRWYTLRGFHSTHDVIPRSSTARICSRISNGV